MAAAHPQQDGAVALRRIEEAILPTLPRMLDSLLDAASLARPGADADAYAAELRSLAGELAKFTVQIEAVLSALPAGGMFYRNATAA